MHASVAAATSAITTAAGSEVAVALHDNGTDIDMYIDTDADGTHDMVLTFDSVSSISASQVDL